MESTKGSESQLPSTGLDPNLAVHQAAIVRDHSEVGWTVDSPVSLGPAEEHQEKHYNKIAEEYETHYSDPSSCEYRRRFIYDPMFSGIDLAGKSVLDAMCGSGQTTGYLLERGASVTGIDISSEVIEAFQTRWPHATAVRRSLLDSKLPECSYDCVSVVGGLHHLHPHVTDALVEIHRLLKPRGYLCFMEPHSGSFPNLIRKFWYKHDRFFSYNEAAIDLNALEKGFSSQFEIKSVKYQGNLGFLLVLNSLIFRIPPGFKRYYSPALMSIEGAVNRLQRKFSSCFVVAQWQKK